MGDIGWEHECIAAEAERFYYLTKRERNQGEMDPPGIEPGASSVRGMRSTDELRARLFIT